MANVDDAVSLDWTDLDAVLQYITVAPPEFTIASLRELVEDLVALLGRCGPDPTMAELERALVRTESVALPVASVLELWRACRDADEPASFEALPLSTFARAFSRRLGSIQPNDVVELTTMAAEVGRHLDVMEPLRLSRVVTALSPQGLRTLSLTDMRHVLERQVMAIQGGPP